MKMAFIHDWLNGMRGGEKCLETLLEIFPKTPIFTLLYQQEKVSELIRQSPITSSWIGKLPFWREKYRYYLPLFPFAIKSFDLSSYEAILSISHCAAKAVRIPPKSLHICYCLTPMRYLWGFYEEYFGKGPYHWLKHLGLQPLLSFLKKWDFETAKNVHHFIAISNYVAERIKKIYGRESRVIYPPVDTHKYFYDESETKENYFLIASALVPYKRIDIAIEAFNKLKQPLKIIGAGTELNRLKAKAGPTIEFLGWQSDVKLREYYSKAKAFIFPSEEDFGITPLEAQACGTPVIAYGKGGALETIQDQKTGIFFNQQHEESLIEAIEKFNNISYDRRALRQNALRFRKEVFQEQFKSFLKEKGIE